MTQTIKKAINKLKALGIAFMDSKFMKAWEKAAIKRAETYLSKSTMRELQALSDKELRDIGLNRGEIYDVAMKAHKNT